MKAILASLGTSGDFEPMLALAVGLKRRGHHPVLANSPDFAERARRHDIPFVSIGPHIAELGLKRCLTEILALESPVAQAAAMIATVLPFVPQMVDDLDRASAGADVLVCLPFQVAGFMSHERTGIPFVAWSFSPFGAMPGRQLADATDDAINRARLSAGLRPLSSPFGEAIVQSRLALFATSGHVFRRPRSWPSHYHLTGYFTIDEDWQPDASLLRFIESGPRPVVVSFGSMRHDDPDGVSRLLFEAVEKVGCRAVIQDGWSGLAGVKSSSDVYMAAGFCPHQWLFQHASCVVHHGAAGTTASALKAGVPSIIVPHALDQPIWAELMRACGAASAVIPFRQLSVDRLAAAIDHTLSSGGGESLARLAGRVRDENGVQHAISLMETTLGFA